MTYSLLNSVFLGLAFWFFVATMAIIGVQMKKRAAGRDAVAGRIVADGDVSRPPRRPSLIGKYLLTLAVLLVFTAVFDNLIIGVGIVAYDPAKISGLMIGLAPIEDFAYTLAAVLVLPTLWGLLGHIGPFKGTPTIGSAGSAGSESRGDRA
jgi:lycopene cyclase domain-containing protein